MTPVRVVIVRHAEAAAGRPDELRPLTPHGHEQARELGRRLVRDGLRPDAVLSSPLLRARETAALVAHETGAQVEPDDRLAPGATADDVRGVVAGRGGVVVVVGHQPDCGEIAAELGGVGPPPAFPPAGTCVVEVEA